MEIGSTPRWNVRLVVAVVAVVATPVDEEEGATTAIDESVAAIINDDGDEFLLTSLVVEVESPLLRER